LKFNRTKRAAINTASGFLYKIVSILLPFIVRTIIIKTLGDSYVGLNSLFTSILTVLSMAELGFGSAIVYYMYKPIAEDDVPHISALLNYYQKMYKVIGIVILIAGAIVIPFLPALIKSDLPADINLYLLYLIYLSNTVIGYFLFAYRTSIFLANQRNDIVFNISTVISLVQYILQIIVLLVFRNYYLYIIVFALTVVPQNIATYLLSKKRYPNYECKGELTPEVKKDFHNRVIALMGHKIGATFIVSIGSILISALLGLVALAKYSNYFYIYSSIIAITNIIIQSLLPSIGNKLITDSKEEAYFIFTKLSYMWIWLVGWCSISLLYLYNPFVRIWLGEEYTYPFTVVSVIVLYYFAWQFRLMGLTFKDAAGLWKKDWYKPYLGMIINTVGSFILIVALRNVIGVLIPTIFVMLVIYFPIEVKILFSNVFPKTYTLKYLRQVATLILNVVFIAAIMYPIVSNIRMDGILGFILKVLICVIVPNILFVFMTFRTKEFIYFKNKISLLMRAR